MILAVDAGNSRIKWGMHDGLAWIRKGWVSHADAVTLERDWLTLPEPSRIVVSNVAGDAMRLMLEQMLTRWTVVSPGTYWITSLPEQCGVYNRYDNPAQLGCDRWAALIAAWRRCAGACVVVNAGTAVTVDALTDEGVFLGGMIVPGLLPMRQALARRSTNLSVACGHFSQFPGNTADAVHSGILSAIVGAVEKMVAVLEEKCGKTPLCLVSGGDAALVRERLSVDAMIVDNLVLDGLIEMSQGYL